MASLARAAEKSLNIFAALLLLGMTVSVFVQISNRYFFGNPLSWTEEVARLTFIWIIPLGAYLALRANTHIAVETFVKRYCSPDTHARIKQVYTFLIMYCLGYLVCMSVRVLLGTYESTTPILEVSSLWIHLPIPIFTVLMILHLIGDLWKMNAKEIGSLGSFLSRRLRSYTSFLAFGPFRARRLSWYRFSVWASSFLVECP